MPQMSPSWWIMMLMTTTILIMLIMTIKFHNKENKMNKLIKKNSTTYWKW
uniref:ATP synthase F0 subunit 8 n=1 Tax=Olidiana obliquea TaxID=2816128 RepID=A0A898P8H1_9HEMI|nr:ATP synthase F0 subunit 8 [Olidiana obliquea]QSJ61371.1 ATP synthase F0 subunit 8 [Olidiana obliquea]